MQTLESTSSIPQELINIERWVLHKNKIPYQINGMRADSTNPNTWTSYEEVMKHVHNFSGFGYVLTKDEPYTVIDLDDCIVNGQLKPEAKSLVDTFDSYTEYSQSGNGLHIFIKGKKPGTRSKNTQKGIEMYDNQRFIIMTGNHYKGTPHAINERQDLLNYVYDTYFSSSPKKSESNVATIGNVSPSLSDIDVITKAASSRSGDKFKQLYDGNWSNYGSQSEADQALCNMIAFYTQDTGQIDRIFSNSGLYREKWDRADYKATTIQNAIDGLSATYQQPKAQDFQLHVKQEKNDTPKLVLTDKGNVRKLLSNLKEILRCDPKLKKIGFNEFTQEVTINNEAITDDFIAKIRYRIDSNYQITFTKDDVIDMLGILARERNSYHPIKRMIEYKKWDKKPRAESVFIDYLGADDNSYTRAITRKWLAGAVARIYEPGIKMEIVPVLQGSQGIGKSTLAARLGRDFFVDSLASLGNSKDDYQLLIGSWIVELSELSSLGSTKIEKVKGFISAQFDKIRLPYGRVTQNYKRTCVFIGTTNNEQFLSDLTGNRRFFPIPLNNTPTLNIFKLDKYMVQQIWAEAYHLYKNNEKLYLESTDEEIAEVYRNEAMEENLFYRDIEDYLNMSVPKEWNNLSPIDKKKFYENHKNYGGQAGTEAIDRTTAKEIAFILGIESTSIPSQSQMKRINLYMSNLAEWEKQSVWIQGKSAKGFKKVRS